MNGILIKFNDEYGRKKNIDLLSHMIIYRKKQEPIKLGYWKIYESGIEMLNWVHELLDLKEIQWKSGDSRSEEEVEYDEFYIIDWEKLPADIEKIELIVEAYRAGSNWLDKVYLGKNDHIFDVNVYYKDQNAITLGYTQQTDECDRINVLEFNSKRIIVNFLPE